MENRKTVKCCVCNAEINSPIFASAGDKSITSLCKIVEKRIEVYFCRNCEHLQTAAVENLAEYYSNHYKISLDSEDDDQLYEVKNGRKIFRTEHQVQMLKEKVNFVDNIKILDYGCAKSSTMQYLNEQHNKIDIYLFDVSEMYIPYWKKFVPESNYAMYSIPDEWRNRFDVVTSFFALEHVEKPLPFLSDIKSLLAPNGLFYCIVPNVLTNIADFVVADHTNHFTENSLYYLFEQVGLEIKDLDLDSHRGAIIVIATPKKETILVKSDEKKQSVAIQIKELAEYWKNIVGKINQFENAVSKDNKAVIYGSGFYGTFIAACIEDLSRIAYFVDQNPFLQGKTLIEIPIISPDQLPDTIENVYVGLNPTIAENIIESVESWRNKSHNYLFL